MKMARIRDKKIIYRNILLYTILGIYAFIILFPLYMVMSASFKNNRGILADAYGFNFNAGFSNYIDIFQKVKFLTYFRNSAIVFVGAVIILLVVSVIAAYALAKYKFKLNTFIYSLFILGLFLPIRLATVNVVQIIQAIGLYNNLAGLILVNATTGIALAVFVLKDFIEAIPEEISQSARIDGCTEFGIFWRIILPLIKPAIATVTILNILRIWNDLWWALLLIKDQTLKTIPVAAQSFVDEYMSNFGGLFAALNVSLLPMLIIYIILSKQIVKGVTAGALKG